MTNLLYQTDSYLNQFTAVITAVDPESKSVTLGSICILPRGWRTTL